jgi:hypothetical protein
VAVIERLREKLDRRLHRSIGDWDFEMPKSLDVKNPEIAICDFVN